MYLADKAVRDLLPFTQDNSSTTIGSTGAALDGTDAPSAAASTLPLNAMQATIPSGISTEVDFELDRPEVVHSALPPSGVAAAPCLAEGSTVKPVGLIGDASPVGSVWVSETNLVREPAAGTECELNRIDQSGNSQDNQALRHEDGPIRPSVAFEPNHHKEDADLDSDDLKVAQNAEVDQDASIFIHGYGGEIVARLHIDQDITMVQGIDVTLDIDAKGGIAFELDQEMRVDQEIDIDLEIFDADGVLYVDLYMSDSVEIEQSTSVGIRSGSGLGSSVDVDQTIEMDQDVDIDIDIADDLAERYLISVDIDIDQEIEADQDALVEIEYRNDDIDWTVDANQTTAVEQEMVAQIDFTAV